MSYGARPPQERLTQTDSQVLGFPMPFGMDFGQLSGCCCMQIVAISLELRMLLCLGRDALEHVLMRYGP